jgi:hypothetical protein
MVHIVPPAALAGGVHGRPQPDDTPTLRTDSALAGDSAPAPSTLDDFAAAGLDLETMASGAGPISDPPTELPFVDVTQTAAAVSPILPAPAEMLWRKVAVWGATGGVGVFLLGGLVGALWVGSADDQSNTPALAEQQAIESAAETPAASNSVDETPVAPTALVSAPLPAPDKRHDPAVDTDPAAPPDSEESDVASAEGDESVPELPPLPAPASSPANDVPPIAVESTPEAVVDDKVEPQRDVDLLSFDPAYLELALGTAGGSSEIGTEPKSPPDTNPSHVASFEPVEEGTPAPGTPPHSPGAAQEISDAASEVGPALANIADDPAAPQQDPRAPVRRGPPAERAGARPNVAELLALPIGQMEITSAPLDQWLDSVSDLLAVPITLQPQALVRAGVAADESLTFRSAGATAGDILAESLAKHRLSFREEHGQLVVIRSGMDTRRTQDYRVADLLAGGQRDAQPIADLIQTLIEPESWQPTGGKGHIDVAGTTLTIDHELGVHLEVLVLLERMLLARDLPTKTRYPRERLSISTSYGKLLPALDTPTTFTFLPWTRLADVARYWREALGVSVLVDWRSLADVELAPDSLVACSATDQRWEDALDAILTPLDLTWRAVDGQTIQVTTRAAAHKLRTIEFYPVADLVRRKFSGADALVTALQQTLGPDATNTQFVYDSGSGYLLVLAPGDAHRQLTKQLATM